MARRFPRLGFWTLSTAFWSAFGLLLATSAWTDLARRGTVVPWGPLARVYWLGFLPWVPFTALIFAVVRRWQPQRDHWRRVGLAWSATAGIILLVYVPIDGLLSQWYSGRSFEWSAAISAVPAQAILLDLGLVVGVFAAAHQRLTAQRAARRSHELQALALQNATLSAQLAAARLAMLQAQLEPHFLFNALNTVSALIRKERPDQAQEALSRLSTLLRYATSAPDREQSTVGEELEFAENYLAFQHLRFGDRLVVAVDADAALDTEPTLPLLLQPLIENAVAHGVERHEGTSTVSITLSRPSPAMIRFEVHNRPGLRHEAGTNPGLGVGLANLRRRLHARYGERFTLGQQHGPHGYSIHVEVPCNG